MLRSIATVATVRLLRRRILAGRLVRVLGGTLILLILLLLTVFINHRPHRLHRLKLHLLLEHLLHLIYSRFFRLLLRLRLRLVYLTDKRLIYRKRWLYLTGLAILDRSRPSLTQNSIYPVVFTCIINPAGAFMAATCCLTLPSSDQPLTDITDGLVAITSNTILLLETIRSCATMRWRLSRAVNGLYRSS